MTFYKQLSRVLVLSQAFLLGCSQHNEYAAMLPAAVQETSGLACLDNGNFLTINDSGNPAILWEVSGVGKIQRQVKSKQPNTDWEALTRDADSLYIADTGNNRGQRNSGQIYVYPLSNKVPKEPTVILRYQFAEFPEKPLLPYRHDYDIEAVAANKQYLVMFSKSWTGGPSQVYRLTTKTPETQQIKPIAQIENLPGVVTDATWSEKHQVYLLTGYANFQQSLLSVLLSGHWSPFIAVVSPDFQVLRVKSIPDAGQLEAVCVDTDDYIWLSQEQYKKSPAKLWRFGTLGSLLK